MEYVLDTAAGLVSATGAVGGELIDAETAVNSVLVAMASSNELDEAAKRTKNKMSFYTLYFVFKYVFSDHKKIHRGFHSCHAKGYI